MRGTLPINARSSRQRTVGRSPSSAFHEGLLEAYSKATARDRVSCSPPRPPASVTLPSSHADPLSGTPEHRLCLAAYQIDETSGTRPSIPGDDLDWFQKSHFGPLLLGEIRFKPRDMPSMVCAVPLPRTPGSGAFPLLFALVRTMDRTLNVDVLRQTFGEVCELLVRVGKVPGQRENDGDDRGIYSEAVEGSRWLPISPIGWRPAYYGRTEFVFRFGSRFRAQTSVGPKTLQY
ncbi:hypothetical protein FA13DRAFT_1749979 [Coprinellus micaceus]|uniref:Uncharacterized protein n=1 Tax=Coprinellus micaceus TaxID=71717 RepID=A0A4Y7RCA0_COPMI|nr:hypothetical protein FA13DRAFT_1749979 [Coprinellus micaceus]